MSQICHISDLGYLSSSNNCFKLLAHMSFSFNDLELVE